MGVCNCSIICCTLLYVHSSFAIILMRKRDLAALLSLSSCCLVIVVWLFLAVSLVCLQFVLFVCFVALRPKSTAMVIAGRSVHLTTDGQA